MHELTLAMTIVEMAISEAEKNNTGAITEIELEVGELSGVDVIALNFALSFAIKNTKIENAGIKINRIQGKGYCFQCDCSFVMTDLWTLCPKCKMPVGKILGGEELRIVSLFVED